VLKATTQAITFLVLLLIGSTNSAQPNAGENCDMAAMISQVSLAIPQFSGRPGTFDDPSDFFDFLIERSTSSANPDGYGILCAGDDGLFPAPGIIADRTEIYSAQAWYVKAPDTASNAYYFSHYPGPMRTALSAITRTDSGASVVLGHARNASSSAVGSHPFRFQYDGRIYAFVHNGSIESDIKSALYTALGGAAWFDQHPPNWTDDYGTVTNLVDSEVLFHWIMSRIMAHEGDVFKGALEALTATIGRYNLEDEFRQDFEHNTVNFVLSDGQALYLFRNSGNAGPRLSWAESQPGLLMVKTQHELERPLTQFDFVGIHRCGQPTTLVGVLDYNPADFVSGKLEDATWSGTAYVTHDTIVPTDVTLDVDGTVQFIKPVEFVINGTLNLHAGAEIHLVNGSTIFVEDRPAALGLTWSSMISCAPSSVDLADQSGSCAKPAEISCGNGIIARNGDVIATTVNPPHRPCSPFPYQYEEWRDYFRWWDLRRLLRQCSCRGGK
jgi:hypothetical protein